MDKFSFSDNKPNFTEDINQRALRVATTLNNGHEVQKISGGPPSWVFKSVDNTEDVSEEVIRLVNEGNIEQLLEEASVQIEVLEDMRANGASILKFTRPPEIADGFVATFSELLPGEFNKRYFDFGGTVAKFHNASQPESVGRLGEFDPLRTARYAIEYMKDRQRFAGIEFGPDLLELLISNTKRGQVAVDRMLDLSKDRNRPLVVVHGDIHDGQIKFDNADSGTLLDLDWISQGPLEYDLARLKGQWVQRFGSSPEEVADFFAGYERLANIQPDPEILKYAVEVANVKYSTIYIYLVIQAMERGQKLDDYLVNEGIWRLKNIENPDVKWVPRPGVA